MCVPPAKKNASGLNDEALHRESFAGWLSRMAARVVLAPLVFVRAGFGDRIIWGILGRDYIYNVSWEDPRIDRNELKLSETDHVITLASAGWKPCMQFIEFRVEVSNSLRRVVRNGRRLSFVASHVLARLVAIGWYSFFLLQKTYPSVNRTPFC